MNDIAFLYSIFHTVKQTAAGTTTLHINYQDKQFKTLSKDYMVRLKTWDLRSNESRDHYLEDGNLVHFPRCSFSSEAAFQL